MQTKVFAFAVVLLFLLYHIGLNSFYQLKWKTEDKHLSIPTQASTNTINKKQDESKASIYNLTKEVPIKNTYEFEKRTPLYACYHKFNLESEAFLLDDIHKSKRQPTPDKTIFFIITNCFENNSIDIGKR